MRLPKFRVRTLMVALVAAWSWMVVAKMLWGPELEQRRVEYRTRAEDHADLARNYAELVASYSTPVARRGGCVWPPRTLAEVRLSAAYHARLKTKYERAARFPWLPVAPDPPPP